MKRTKIVHIITGLNVGGAEMMLYKSLNAPNILKQERAVISMQKIGIIGRRIKGLGIPVYALNIDRDNPRIIQGLTKLINLLKQIKPDVIKCWMYHANIAGGIAGKYLGIPIIWGIHHDNLSPDYMKTRTLRLIKLSILLSKFIPDKILYVSKRSALTHENIGYPRNKTVIVPNGVDVSVFHPISQNNRIKIFQELNIPPGAPLVGVIARFDPQKDIGNFIKAASIINKKMPRVNFLLCGRDMTNTNKELMDLIDYENLSDRFYLLGQRDDIPSILNLLDVACLSSLSEAFPNVLLEAMACGVPCVATDVGDSKYIVNRTGIIVLPQNPSQLANGLLAILNMGKVERKKMGKKARQRIIDNFSIDEIALRRQLLYNAVANN